MSFIVFSLPRSRSTWLSFFLSYGGRLIGHDIGIDCATPADFLDRIGDGTCETGAAFAFPAIQRERPDLRFAVVLRDPCEVADSLARYGVTDVLTELQRRDDDLWDIASRKGVLAVPYEHMDDEATAQALFEHCLGVPFDRAWWLRFRHVNIQVDVLRTLRRVYDNRETIARLKADARSL